MKVYGITGRKNSGKTGLVERLVAHFIAQGLRVSTVKHAHHEIDVDHPGRDSFRHRAAGAAEVIVASPHRWALMGEMRGASEPPLDALLAKLSPVDLVLIEGYKTASHPKIECHRAETGQSLLSPENTTIRSVASDSGVATALPRFDLDDTSGIAGFITTELGL